MNRRSFVRNAGIATAGAILLSPLPLFAQQPTVKIGMIGVGLRGQNHLGNLLRRKDVSIDAICDIDEGMLQTSLNMIKEAGKPAPKIFRGDPNAWKKMLELKELDAVIISTPWEWHKPMIIGSMEAGIKYVGVEVMIGITLKDHWDVVKAAEKHRAQVMMLENVCYRRDVMAVLNMVRQGLFGEIIHLQGGYQHDLRNIKFNDGKSHKVGVEFGEKGWSEARWRTNHSVTRNGDLYPTHGIGPVAEMININRGNQFVSLSSFASKARGLHNYVVEHGGADHPNAKVEFKLGDVVTTMIKCANGETIMLQHDTNLPRPYSLGFRVQGTKGLWMDLNRSIYLEGTSPKSHAWEDAKPYLEKYDHPLWARWSRETEGAGHGGMDFFVLHAFVEAIKRRTATPVDVYDAAAWSAITPLSERSIAKRKTVDFPDFTRGAWKTRKNDFALTDEY